MFMIVLAQKIRSDGMNALDRVQYCAVWQTRILFRGGDDVAGGGGGEL